MSVGICKVCRCVLSCSVSPALDVMYCLSVFEARVFVFHLLLFFSFLLLFYSGFFILLLFQFLSLYFSSNWSSLKSVYVALSCQLISKIASIFPVNFCLSLLLRLSLKILNLMQLNFDIVVCWCNFVEKGYWSLLSNSHCWGKKKAMNPQGLKLWPPGKLSFYGQAMGSVNCCLKLVGGSGNDCLIWCDCFVWGYVEYMYCVLCDCVM